MIHPDKIGAEAKKKEDENFKFRSYLKGHADEEELDKQFARLHKELFADYDCSKCRNCCKMYKGNIPEEDIEKDAEYLGIMKAQFIDFFLKKGEHGIGYQTKHKPCDFLQEDDSCKLGDCKPDNCKKYPYTDQPERLWSLLGILDTITTFMMLTMQDRMNLTSEYAMFHQKNLTCYWGNREELTDKQRKTIKELGYTYRGKNQWLYFLSFVPGYFPYNMNQEEVLRMSEYMQNLELALKCYEEDNVQVNFESGNMFHVVLNEDKEILSRGEAPLPFTAFQYGNLLITDEELLSDLAKVPKSNAILEADVSVLGAAVSDKKYERPANPALPLLGDAKTGVIIKFEMVEPEEDAMVMLAEILIGFIFKYGAPKEVRVSNVIVEAGLEQVCEVCGIKLRRVRRLPGLEEFKNSMRRFG